MRGDRTGGAPELLDSLTALLRERSGLVFPDSRRASAEHALARAMERAGHRDPNRYRELLLESPGALDDLVDALVVGETYFFRDVECYDWLARELLPRLLHGRPAGHVLRLWSAACSTGEEPYSLAILMWELGLAEGVHILATDISEQALEQARQGRYRPWSLRGPGAERARRWLKEERDGSLVLDGSIRRLVHFRRLNLSLPVYPTLASGTARQDLILCRNVLIYFDAGTVAEVADRLFRALAPGGVLLSGPSDPPLGDHPSVVSRTAAIGQVYERVAGAGRTGRRPSGADSGERAAGSPAPAAPRPARHADHAPAAPPPADGSRERVARIRSLADAGRAEEARLEALRAAHLYPLDAGLHYLLALTGLEAGRTAEAVEALRRALYLEPDQPVLHFTLGCALRRLGDRGAAARAYRNALRLARAVAPGTPLAYGDGEPAESLAHAARALLAATGEVVP